MKKQQSYQLIHNAEDGIVVVFIGNSLDCQTQRHIRRQHYTELLNAGLLTHEHYRKIITALIITEY